MVLFSSFKKYSQVNKKKQTKFNSNSALEDVVDRVAACQETLRFNDQYDIFFHDIISSDKAAFNLNGAVNRQKWTT